jgi:hypothetical protein
MTFSEKLLSTGNLRGNFWLRLILALAGYRRVREPKLRSNQMNKYFHVFLQNLKNILPRPPYRVYFFWKRLKTSRQKHLKTRERGR